ncbi:MAG: hypothetical protein MJ199_00310 [Bacilli bacterium]|nr:hypothetical protein [Bacilli bacterium]
MADLEATTSTVAKTLESEFSAALAEFSKNTGGAGKGMIGKLSEDIKQIGSDAKVSAD